MPKTAKPAKRKIKKRNTVPSGLRSPRSANIQTAIVSLAAGIQRARKALTVKQTFLARVQQDKVVLAALGTIAAREVREAFESVRISPFPVLDPEKLFLGSFQTELLRLSKPRRRRRRT